MSGENRELYHHDHFLRDRNTFALSDDLSSLFSQRPGSPTDLHGLDPPFSQTFLSFADYFQGSADYGQLARAFDVSCSSPADELGPHKLMVESGVGGNNMNCCTGGGGAGGGMTPVTPNSSVSSSSNEAAGEEDSGRCKKDQQKEEEEEEKAKGDEDGGDKSKKV